MTRLAESAQENRGGEATTVTQRRGHSSSHPPVFLHCDWRSRGTWIWNRFRGLDGVRGYYEPLAESLATLRPATLAGHNAGNWPSGHTGLERPYFEEFAPLLNPDGRGVAGYQARFVTGDFFAAPDAELPELELYLRRLIDAAEARGEQPVLKFCRSAGRIAWMRRCFPHAVHIVVRRNPLTQFESSVRQFVPHGNRYFLAMPQLILAANRDVPAVQTCLRHLRPNLPSLLGCGTLSNQLRACEETVRYGTPDDWYRAFLAFWVLTAAYIPDQVDLVINSDLLTHASHYRLRCESDLAQLTGQMVDFGDLARPEVRTAPNPSGLRRSELLRAHHGAQSFLSDHLGFDWADNPVFGQVGVMLAEAVSHGLGSGIEQRPPHLRGRFDAGANSDRGAEALHATGRALCAERELADLYASHSWQITAPLRWIRTRLSPPA